MKRAIVTGANGFVGNAVVKELIRNNVLVYAVHRPGHNENIEKLNNVMSIPCSLSDINSLKDKFTGIEIDVFYHLAWDGSAGQARANTQLQLQNAQWTIDALKIAKEIGCKKFVSAGSIMEHETIAAAYKQGNKPGLGYIYGSGKLVAHTMCASVAAEIGIDIMWAIITNAYGPGEKSSRMVNTTIKKIINNESPQFTSGTQNYDFIYIDDVARAFYLIGKNGKPFNEYIIGSSCAKPLREFLMEMKMSIAPNLDFIFGDVPFTGINLPIEKFDSYHTETDTGFKAKTSFAEGVKLTMDWLKSETEEGRL